MTRLKAKATRTVAATAGAFALLATGLGAATAQDQQPKIPKGWFKACTKQQDVDICNVQNIVVADTGQLVTGISLIDVKGKVTRKVLQITVPSGRLIPPGIGLQVDNGATQKLDYAICPPQRCIAEAPLSDQVVASFKKGSELTLTSVNFQNQPNPVKVSLQGFTDAFDGEPMKQSDIEDRQKALKDFVTKNNKEFSDKLKEEQEKAKKKAE